MHNRVTHGIRPGAFCDIDSLRASVRAFERWLDKAGCESYDPYDIWGTKYGIMARRVFYQRPLCGTPLVAPLILLELVCPQLRACFVKKLRYPTADAQLALAFLNLHAASQDSRYLAKAVGLAQDLLRTSIPGYSGHCWGYPFDWQCAAGFCGKNTPLITATPYCFEVFLRLFDATGEREYLNIAASIARFVFADLKDTEVGEDASAGSYSPEDNGKVINASAYRAFVLFEAASRLHIEAYREKAWRNLNFILKSQRADGSWLYAVDSPAESFIDHFHTCFVLKNLCKLNQRLQNEAVKQAIQRGYAYYHLELFHGEGTPKSFTVKPRLQIVRLEMYNVAEAITLGVLLRDEIPHAYQLAEKLARRVSQKYQCKDGHFVTRVHPGGIRHTFPFLRWPQAQLFLALTNLLLVTTRQGETGT